MLKPLGISGAYRDDQISVSVQLENPADHDLPVSVLAFSVTLRTMNGETLHPNDFTFYIFDEGTQLHNTQNAPYLSAVCDTEDTEEPTRIPDRVICTDFKPEYLFQDLRIAFYYRPYKDIRIIGLQH
jgi:hypothetical protein